MAPLYKWLQHADVLTEQNLEAKLRMHVWGCVYSNGSNTLKEIISQTDLYLVNLSSKRQRLSQFVFKKTK